VFLLTFAEKPACHLKQFQNSLTTSRKMVCCIIIVLVSSWSKEHVKLAFHLHFLYPQ